MNLSSKILCFIFFVSFNLHSQKKSTFYYDSGSVKSHGYLVNGKKEGVWKFYYENGNIKERGIFKSDIKDGSWVYHTKEGKLDYYIEYIEGDKIYQQWYNSKNARRYFVRYQPDSVPN